MEVNGDQQLFGSSKQNLYKFLSNVEHKRRYFEEFWITKQLLLPTDFHSKERNTMEVNGDHQLFDYQHSLKYLLLCST